MNFGPIRRAHIRFPIACIVLILTVVLFGALSAVAVQLDGRLSSELYFYEQGDQTHIRPYEYLRANLLAWQDANRVHKLSFHTYLRWTTDLSDRLASDPQLFIYDAYAKYADKAGRVTVSAGRQYVYSGAGSALLDGARLRLGPMNGWRLDIFGGSSVDRLNPEKIRSMEDFLVLGGRLSAKPRSSTRLGLSWMRRLSYGSVERHRINIDAQERFKQWRLFAKAGLDPDDLSLAELRLRTAYDRAKWYLSAEYSQRNPSISNNSLFSLIDYYRYREMRFELNRKLRPNLTAIARIRTAMFDADGSWSSNVGIRAGYFSVTWRHQEGRGDDDRLVGSVNHAFNDQWTLFGRFNYGRYSVQEEQSERITAYSSGLGVSRRFDNGWLARIEGQFLHNATQSDDYRIHIRLSRNFRLGK